MEKHLDSRTFLITGAICTIEQKALTWAQAYLKLKPKNVFKPVRLMPWSRVYTAELPKERVFLKIVMPPFDIEVKLLPYLATHYPEGIPKVIATNKALKCILMHDAGTPLRALLKQRYDIALAKKSIAIYAKLQQKTCAHADTLLALGVPDWRLHILPQKYFELLQRTDFLTDDGLSLDEISRLKSQHLNIQALCELLLNTPIPAAIEHADFHDNNILYKYTSSSNYS
jgi:hypothetical protein